MQQRKRGFEGKIENTHTQKKVIMFSEMFTQLLLMAGANWTQ